MWVLFHPECHFVSRFEECQDMFHYPVLIVTSFPKIGCFMLWVLVRHIRECRLIALILMHEESPYEAVTAQFCTIPYPVVIHVPVSERSCHFVWRHCIVDINHDSPRRLILRHVVRPQRWYTTMRQIVCPTDLIPSYHGNILVRSAMKAPQSR